MPEENQEQQFVTLEQLAEIQEQMRAQLLEEMNKTVTGATSRSNKALTAKLTEEIQNQFQPILEALKPQSSQTTTTEPTPAPTAESNDNGLADGLKQFREQLAQLQAQNQQLAKALEAQQQETVAERMQRLQTQHRSSFYSAIADKVTDPEAFFTVLQAKTNAEFDPEKGYVVRSKDDFGNEVVTPLNQLADNYLNESMAYFAKPRPGNGTGAAPTGQQGRVTQSVFQGENTSNEAILKLTKEAVDPIAAITEELLKSAS